MATKPMTFGLVSTPKKKPVKRASKKPVVITDKRRIKQILHGAEYMDTWYDNDPSGMGRVASQEGRYKGRKFRVDYDTSGHMPDNPTDDWFDNIAYQIVMEAI